MVCEADNVVMSPILPTFDKLLTTDFYLISLNVTDNNCASYDWTYWCWSTFKLFIYSSNLCPNITNAKYSFLLPPLALLAKIDHFRQCQIQRGWPPATLIFILSHYLHKSSRFEFWNKILKAEICCQPFQLSCLHLCWLSWKIIRVVCEKFHHSSFVLGRAGTNICHA